MEWSKGRQLTNATGSYNVTYAYDADGIRSSKTVATTIYNYITQNGRVVRQTWGSNVMDFIYDNNGSPYAMIYNGSIYYYLLNQQGDVFRIIDSNGATQATYVYDAWGEVLSATGTMASVNPLRFKGYYYDSETGFYYLQSRYYDPTIGRFINADTFASTGQGFLGYNMFAYCNNNPITYHDDEGTLPRPMEAVYNDGARRKNIIDRWAEKGVTVEKTASDNIRINNSYLISDGKEMTEYVDYLMNKSKYSKFFKGSSDGVIYEWTVHNWGSKIATIIEIAPISSSIHSRCKDVDLGPTIYHDEHNFLISGSMWALYYLWSPESAQKDFGIYMFS